MKYFSFLMLSLVYAAKVFAADNVSQCRKNIDATIKMTSEAKSLNAQCTDAVTKDLLAKKEYEVNELTAYGKELDKALKENAVSANAVIVNCGVESMNKIEKVVKCRAIKAEKDILLNRIDRLNLWETKFKEALSNPITAFEKIGDPPCVSSVEFTHLEGIKNFNKDLYKSWEECRAR